mmetsp:Transcript_91840/g.230775  ORF Transcript_91840/g.230775 Transcript_91840/m.230775 type:complete len:163 (-) Transcript_91840:431-919(-)
MTTLTFPLSPPSDVTCRNTFLEWAEDKVQVQVRRRSASVPKSFRYGDYPVQSTLRPKCSRRRVSSDPPCPSASHKVGEKSAHEPPASGNGTCQPLSAVPLDSTAAPQPERKKRPNRGWGGLPSWVKKTIRKKQARDEAMAASNGLTTPAADADSEIPCRVSV